MIMYATKILQVSRTIEYANSKVQACIDSRLFGEIYSTWTGFFDYCL